MKCACNLLVNKIQDDPDLRLFKCVLKQCHRMSYFVMFPCFEGS